MLWRAKDVRRQCSQGEVHGTEDWQRLDSNHLEVTFLWVYPLVGDCTLGSHMQYILASPGHTNSTGQHQWCRRLMNPAQSSQEHGSDLHYCNAYLGLGLCCIVKERTD